LLFAGELGGIRVSSGPSSTRVVLDLDRPTQYEILELTGPDRVVVDLPATAVGSTLRLPDAKGRVRAVRTGLQPGGKLRVVFELNGPAAATSFPLTPEGGFGHRLVIDLAGAGTRTATTSGSAAPVQVPARSGVTAPANRPPAGGSLPAPALADTYTGRDLIIAIDAGHGGTDPGTSERGVREKDVVLQIARRLAELVDREPGLKAVLIRDSDRYVELRDRIRIAQRAQADLFLSIHVDHSDSPSVAGAAVYSIDTGRAATETAKRLADRENASDLIGGESLADKDDNIARVLLDLAQSASISKSLAAGDALIDRLGQVTTLRKTKVQQGSFVVLTSPEIPSLLIEAAFVSNPREAASLRESGFQQALAGAMLGGILDFFRTHSPSDSYLAHNPPPVSRAPIRHVISRGETLSGIAERYRISLRELRRSNAIDGDVIRIGQVLTIPTTG
jgi:N-acetylmuramoyl-L-alanine amidase